MRSFKQSFPLCALLLAMNTSLALAQAKIFYDDNAPKQYNENIQPIYDEIDALKTKLNNESLSMSEAAKIVQEQSALRRKADALWTSTQGAIDQSFKNARDAINEYNTANRQIEFESAIAGSIADGLNSVSKYPTKDAFDANKANLAASWDQNYGSRLKPFGEDFAKMKNDFFARYKEKYGIDLNEAGYSRIGTSNPYTGEVYYKYYGPDGKLIAGQWTNDAEGYEKWKKDVDVFRRRQREQQEQLQQETTALKQFDNQLEQSRSAGQAALASLAQNTRKVNFAGNWSGTDNDGDAIALTLNATGSMLYVERVRGGRTYRHPGTWQQSGSSITMQSSDGRLSWQGTILNDNRIELNGSGGGDRWVDYLSR